MKNLKLLSLLAAALLIGSQSYAADDSDNSAGESSLKMEDVNPNKNKVKGNLDEEITNARMRANSGSKSRWSFSANANYNGGPIKQPFSANRPNPTNDPIAPRTSMSADLSVRYRFTKNDSVNFGTGMTVIDPLHTFERTDVSTPFATYSRAFAWGPTQNSFSITGAILTDEESHDGGQAAYVNPGYTILTNVGDTAWQAGLSLDYVQYALTRGVGGSYNYTLGAYPFAEYAFSDTFQFRTVFRPWIFIHMNGEPDTKFTRLPWTQSIGLGIVAARNVYIYPNFQFDWEKWRSADYNILMDEVAKTSTFGVSATINVF